MNKKKKKNLLVLEEPNLELHFFHSNSFYFIHLNTNNSW